jgi:hypothetical protein
MSSEFNRRLDGKKEKEMDLFGGKGGGVDDDQEGGSRLNDISADRQFSTGGHLATTVCSRSDKQLVAVGTEGGTICLCDANSHATLRLFCSSKNDADEGRYNCWGGCAKFQCKKISPDFWCTHLPCLHLSVTKQCTSSSRLQKHINLLHCKTNIAKVHSTINQTHHYNGKKY